jgi:hypothetical protein
MGYNLHRSCFPDLADFTLALLYLLLADLLGVIHLCFRRILAFLPRLSYALLLLGVKGMSYNPSSRGMILSCRR